VAGQVLLAPLDFMVRTQYLHARSTVDRLLELGVVPVVNENDATADDEIRFGDNDRIAALLAQLAGCDLLLLLTDAPGLMDADPRIDERASLIEEIVEVDQDLERLAGGAGTSRGSGGMASKLAAAKMASWAGVRAVIAQADRPGVVADALAGVSGVGTVVQPRGSRLSARKLWIAFAVAPGGTVVVDAGAARALLGGGRSLLAAGVERVEGSFTSGAAVEIMGPEGVVAKGIVSVGADELHGRPAVGRPGRRIGCGRPRGRPGGPAGLSPQAVQAVAGGSSAVSPVDVAGVPVAGAAASPMPSLERISESRACASTLTAACSISTIRDSTDMSWISAMPFALA
jgi:glutamate 5-kinase